MVFHWQKKDVPEEGDGNAGFHRDNSPFLSFENDDGGLPLGNRIPITQKSTKRIKKRKHPGGSDSGRSKKSKSVNNAQISSAKLKKLMLIVGVDIGASFKTNAYSPQSMINNILNWPGSAQYLAKTSSLIAYSAENKSWGPDKKRLQETVIGYEVKSGMKAYTWWKLLLDDSANLSDYDDPFLSSAVGNGVMKLPEGKTATDVASDYLRIFLKIILAEIAKSHTQEVLDSTPVRFVVTVPAIWDDRAQAKTFTALRRAGFYRRTMDSVHLISEPEAAAIAALKQSNEKNPNLIKVNTHAMVCDIGGGTIDLEVLKIVTQIPLGMSPVGVGQGGKCGSTTADRSFMAWLQETFRAELDAIPDAKKLPGSALMTSFENIKRSFQGDLHETYRIPFPALAQQLRGRQNISAFFDAEEGELILQGSQIAKFFKPIIQQACRLIQRKAAEVNEKGKSLIDVLILAGGFAHSEYVFAEIKSFCVEKFQGRMKLLRPDNAWGVISCGAVEYGLDRATIISRVARRHYLMVQYRAFREGIDDENRAVTIPRMGKRVKGSLCLLLKKGEMIRETHKKSESGKIVIDDGRIEALKFSYKIICSDADEPPEWEDDPGCYPLGTMNIDLNPLVQHWNKKGYSSWNFDPSQTPVVVNLNIVMKGGFSAGQMHIQANADKKKVGELSMDYTS